MEFTNKAATRARRTARSLATAAIEEAPLFQSAQLLDASPIQLRNSGITSELPPGSATFSAFSGIDTLSALSSVVALEIDELIVCPPHGAVVKGWMLGLPGFVKAIRIGSGPRSARIDFASTVPVQRPDVLQAHGSRFGSEQLDCGFIAYLPDVVTEGALLHVEVELQSGERGAKGITPSRKRGNEAVRAVLEGTDCRYADVDGYFDSVFGPAVCALSAERLADPFEVQQINYGLSPAKPECTLVIPLYGRIDYLEYQLALLSADPASRKLDIVYVLDDPPQRRELLTLAEVVYARFRLPFRLLLSSRNRGFGPASNLGLKAARAPYVAFVNSDVFPVTADWIGRLIARLKKDPKLGAVGPRLLYADGSIQHEGCYFRPLPEFGGWSFVEHTNKGRRPSAEGELLSALMITAACLVMATPLARELDGFDESYVIGDFEDADLCRRIARKKLGMAVDTAVVCHHLERQSQARLGGHWRMNLTLFNAWVHQRRWIGPAMQKASKP